jgi:WD40 repeat protein
MLAHEDEVCGITAKNSIVASGGNSGKVKIWDLRQPEILSSHSFFRSAVKALQWCPWKLELLAAGGGAKDHHILLWNNLNAEIEQKINATSQVTALRWRHDFHDLVTSHGKGYGLIWDSEHWQYRTVLAGHRGRIVGLAEESGQGLWTLGADETLRFWVSPPSKKEPKGCSKKEDCDSVDNFNLK